MSSYIERSTHNQSPPCPYCGEHQTYSEARPSRPHVVSIGGRKQTEYFTDCRACGERIIWSIRLGNGSLADIAIGKATASWSKPHV